MLLVRAPLLSTLVKGTNTANNPRHFSFVSTLLFVVLASVAWLYLYSWLLLLALSCHLPDVEELTS